MRILQQWDALVFFAGVCALPEERDEDDDRDGYTNQPEEDGAHHVHPLNGRAIPFGNVWISKVRERVAADGSGFLPVGARHGRMRRLSSTHKKAR
ncbi:hypothetical protein D9M68_807860 [compost metagenome]